MTQAPPHPSTETSALLGHDGGTTTSHDNNNHHPPVLHHQDSHMKSLGEDVPVYARPRQRQRWDDHQILPHVNWGDLFFDLFYVAAAYQLAMILKESTTVNGLWYFGACYLAIVAIWYEKLFWDARFAPDDNLFHRTAEVVHLVILGMAIQHIRPVSDMMYTCEFPTTFVFCLCLSLLWLMQVVMYVDLWIHVDGGPEAMHDARSSVRRKLFGALPVWTAAAIAAHDLFFADQDKDAWCRQGNRLPVLLCGLPFLVEQAQSHLEVKTIVKDMGKSHKEFRVPMNLEFTLHRLGEWVMLMLGESVLSLIIVEASPGRRYFVTFSAGVVSVTMMQYLYFRSSPQHADDHAMRRSIAGAIQFVNGLTVYSACLIMLGCSFKLILHYYLDEYEQSEKESQDVEEVEEEEEDLEDMARRIIRMFSWSLASAFFFLDLMVVSHRGWSTNLGRMVQGGKIRWAPTLCSLGVMGFIVLTASLPAFITDLELLSVVGCGIILAQVLLRTLGFRYFPVSKRGMEQAMRWPNVTVAQSISHH